MTKKKNLRSLKKEELKKLLIDWKEPGFRANQIYDWLWAKGVSSIEEMYNIPKHLSSRLKEFFFIEPIKFDSIQKSSDGTIKNAVLLRDGLLVESVLIPTSDRITACVSSQVGCSLDCNFCATARLKRMRNLDPDEIYDQVLAIHRQGLENFNRPLTNVVFMGMGEPLMNYKNVLSAIEKITQPDGLNFSPKRITLSTVGVPKMIKRLADDKVKFNLAVSLHSAINDIRSSIMPINDSAPIEELVESLVYWYRLTKRKITFEYVIWKEINDKIEDVEALIKLCKQVPSKVNLIEYNFIGDKRFKRAENESIDLYRRKLKENGISALIRKSRGEDIDAACGQLANKTGVSLN
tara:strand:+ start:1906 stop:2958 length:1053 start_codon:yes stop_codon:yes gene_type:complete